MARERNGLSLPSPDDVREKKAQVVTRRQGSEQLVVGVDDESDEGIGTE
jgi:hypothetical protein